MPKGKSGIGFVAAIGALALLVAGVSALSGPARRSPSAPTEAPLVDAPGGAQQSGAGAAERAAVKSPAAPTRAEAGARARDEDVSNGSPSGAASERQVTFTQQGTAQGDPARSGTGEEQAAHSLQPARAPAPTTAVSAVTRDPKLAAIVQASHESCLTVCARASECRVSMPGCGQACEHQTQAAASVQASHVRIQSCLAAQSDLDQCTSKLGCEAFEGWLKYDAAGPCTSRTYARNAACPGILLAP